MPRNLLALAAIVLLVFLTPSCGDDDDGGVAPGDTTSPTVASSSPANGDTDVGLVPLIEVTFSKAMDAATINDTTISLATAAVTTAPALTVTYDAGEQRALCFPDSTLAPDATYTVTCSEAVCDAAGNAMASPWSAAFTTGAFDCAHLADRFEDNDSTAEALAAQTDYWYRALTDCDEEGDYFAITLDDTAMCNAPHCSDAIVRL
jgi:hypothetical protein